MLGMRAMIVKEFRELVRDRRTLAMLIVMPLLLLVIFGYAANFYVSSVKTAVVGPQASQVVTTLPSFFDVTVTEPAGTQADARTLLRDNTVDVAFVTGTDSGARPGERVEPVRRAVGRGGAQQGRRPGQDRRCSTTPA